ncbi:hypothetical protein Rfer_3076 [Rhodoferax ferrireducens T118]|uniref:Uncharacterized protein n=2 Tax=Rhodoferax ferrireducens TaxID=192843 RepID=Q21TW7_ALBFT|nr:hypothetical protein Rfer_3076 [Rhodoferax ferrireducens T118]
MGRFVLFIEVVRAMDYWGIHAQSASSDKEGAEHSLDLMYWGWNRAVSELFEPLEQPGFPLMESTPRSRGFAARLMQELGKVSLLRRVADMNERGIMEVARDGNEFQIRMTEDAKAQFADSIESDRLKDTEELLPSASTGWKMASIQNFLRYPGMPGSYFARPESLTRRWLRGDIEELTKTLIRPWDSGHGIMVAYDARIEVDEHYMAEALDLATVWREDSGIHMPFS